MIKFTSLICAKVEVRLEDGSNKWKTKRRRGADNRAAFKSETLTD